MAQPPINPKVLAALKAVAAAKRKPIVVTNPNDPRLKAYQDSARLHEKSMVGEKYWNEAILNIGEVDPELFGKDLGIVKTAPKGRFGENNNLVQDYNQTVEGKLIKPIAPIQYHKYETGYGKPAAKNVKRLDDGSNSFYYVANYKKPEQPVVLQTPTPKPAVVQRTPVVVPAKIPIKLAPTNFVAPLPATPAPQPVAVAQPVQPPPPNKPDSLWAPGQRYSLKDEKVRRMLKAIQSLKRQ